MATTPLVKTTHDYHQFKTLAGNREVSKEHVQNLIKSFEAHPDLASALPLIVNERMEVIDGQHRLVAAEKLGIKVSYMVVPGATIASAQVLNATQRTWRLLDFARSYAGSGLFPYQQFLAWMEEFKGLQPSALLAIVTYSEIGGGSSKAFRVGKFEIVDLERTQRLLGLLDRYREVIKQWGNRGFVTALMYLDKNVEGFDHEQLLGALASSKLEVQGSSKVEFLRALELLYNKGRHSFTRFF